MTKRSTLKAVAAGTQRINAHDVLGFVCGGFQFFFWGCFFFWGVRINAHDDLVIRGRIYSSTYSSIMKHM